MGGPVLNAGPSLIVGIIIYCNMGSIYAFSGQSISLKDE